MPPRQQVKRLLLASLSGASFCACTHTPTNIQTSTMEKSDMTSEDHATARSRPKLDAEAVTMKILELIKSSNSIADFTPERISALTGLEMNFDGPNRFGAGETLTQEWRYSFYVNRAAMDGPLFMFSFDPNDPKESPLATDICNIDFDRFSSELENIGFKRRTIYGEHGRIINYEFNSGSLRVGIGTESEDNAPQDKLQHQCVRSIIVK